MERGRKRGAGWLPLELAPLDTPDASWRVEPTGPDDATVAHCSQRARGFDLPEQRSRERFAPGHRLSRGFIGENACAYA